MSIYAKAVIVVVFYMICITNVHAANLTAASCSQSDVQTQITSAVNGDTIFVPGGSCTWTGRIIVNKSGLSIQGSGSWGTEIMNGGFTVSGYNSVRIANFKFTGITGPAIRIGTGSNGGTPTTGFSIDSNYFNGYASAPIDVWNESTGLIANNKFDAADATIIYVYGRDNMSWSTSALFGTAKQYVFIEDNLFTKVGALNPNHAVMSSWGGSYVFRCNKTIGLLDAVDVHGYGHGTNRRGGRSAEVYGNLFTNQMQTRTIDLRGGSGRVFTNRWDSTSGSVTINLTDYRMASYGLSMAYPTDPNNCSTNSSNCAAADEANCVSLHEGYGGCDQIGRGQDGYGGARQASDPYYFWDNKTLAGTDVIVAAASGTPSTYIQLNRDFYNGSVPSGYAPYTYPHPSRGLSQTTACLTDSNSQAKTGVNFWDSSIVVIKPLPPANLR